MLSPHFKETYNKTGYGSYSEWWRKIKTVNILSLDVKSHSISEALINVELSYYFINGQVDTYDLLEFIIIYDSTGSRWLFYGQKLLKGSR
jgi:hypothetical protein